jgi:hypothetical protein
MKSRGAFLVADRQELGLLCDLRDYVAAAAVLRPVGHFPSYRCQGVQTNFRDWAEAGLCRSRQDGSAYDQGPWPVMIQDGGGAPVTGAKFIVWFWPLSGRP